MTLHVDNMNLIEVIEMLRIQDSITLGELKLLPTLDRNETRPSAMPDQATVNAKIVARLSVSQIKQILDLADKHLRESKPDIEVPGLD